MKKKCERCKSYVNPKKGEMADIEELESLQDKKLLVYECKKCKHVEVIML